jgi:hypothetical protein
MINENVALGLINQEKNNKLRENKEYLNQGKIKKYQMNTLYLMGLDKAERIIKGLVVA